MFKIIMYIWVLINEPKINFYSKFNSQKSVTLKKNTYLYFDNNCPNDQKKKKMFLRCVGYDA